MKETMVQSMLEYAKMQGPSLGWRELTAEEQMSGKGAERQGTLRAEEQMSAKASRQRGSFAAAKASEIASQLAQSMVAHINKLPAITSDSANNGCQRRWLCVAVPKRVRLMSLKPLTQS